MSYTNLAAMASEFENAPSRPFVLTSGGGRGSNDSPEALHQKAMELIQMGLQMDNPDEMDPAKNNPQQASEHYQNGSDLLSLALEGALPSPATEEMQRTVRSACN